jgi:hypothetical protein
MNKFRSRAEVFFTGLLGLLLLASTPPVVAQSEKKLAIASAERTEFFGDDTGFPARPGSVSASPEEIVLVLTIKGFEEEWDKALHFSFHLTSDKSRYECILLNYVLKDGKRQGYRIVFRVPRNERSLVLHYESASVPFSVTGPTKANIKSSTF